MDALLASHRNVVFGGGLRKLLSNISLSAIIGVLMLASSPTVARIHSDPFKPSVSEQIKLGAQAAKQLRKKEKVLPADDIRVKILRKIARRIVNTFPKNEPWHYTFDVIESKDVNAFALPGGSTFFYTGLLSKLTTEDQLAGVLGHELTHVRQQHWASAYASSQKRQLGLTALLVILKANSNIGNLADAVNSLADLNYSRGDEAKADEGGFKASVAAGFNPNGLIDIFKIFEKLGNDGPEFASDHPSNQHRIAHIEDLMKQQGEKYPPETPLPWAK